MVTKITPTTREISWLITLLAQKFLSILSFWTRADFIRRPSNAVATLQSESIKPAYGEVAIDRKSRATTPSYKYVHDRTAASSTANLILLPEQTSFRSS